MPKTMSLEVWRALAVSLHLRILLAVVVHLRGLLGRVCFFGEFHLQYASTFFSTCIIRLHLHSFAPAFAVVHLAAMHLRKSGDIQEDIWPSGGCPH